jgi:hypothetical protein
VAVETHHEQILMSHLGVFEEATSNRNIAFGRHFYFNINAVTQKQSGDVGGNSVGTVGALIILD